MVPGSEVNAIAPEEGTITAYHTSGEPGKAQGGIPPFAGSV